MFQVGTGRNRYLWSPTNKTSLRNWENNMSKILVINKKAEEGLKDLLRSLLKNGKVKGVLTLRRINEGGSLAYSLITDEKLLEDASPLFPKMPANAGGILSGFTMKGCSKEPVAVVLRPCELRAFKELVKFEKGSLDNLLLISLTCGGVFPLDKAVGEGSDELSKYWSDVKKGEINPDIRPVCKGCENFVPKGADMVVELVERDDVDGKCAIYLVTAKGEEFADGIEGEGSEGELKDLTAYREKRGAEKKRLFEEHGIGELGIKGLIDVFGRCIGCKGCRAVCPICFCQSCTFDLQDSDLKASKWESDVKTKGGLRVPPNTIFYHLGRLTHMALYCVSCGMCEDVCPADIPIAIIYKKVGEAAQTLFDYLPGSDMEEEIPLKTFELKELSDVEH
jgi:formate dehydrogenase subunit beta